MNKLLLSSNYNIIIYILFDFTGDFILGELALIFTCLYTYTGFKLNIINYIFISQYSWSPNDGKKSRQAQELAR